MDEFALVAGIDMVSGHGNNGSAPFLQSLVALDRPPLVPEEKEESDGDEDQPGQDALEGIADPAKP